jgi:hypothetical protein
MASDEPLQRSRSSTCVFAPRMLRLVISTVSSDAVWLCRSPNGRCCGPASCHPDRCANAWSCDSGTTTSSVPGIAAASRSAAANRLD